MTVSTAPEIEKTGLTQAQVEASRLQFGRNEIPIARKRGFLQIIRSVLTEPMFLLLLLAAGLYLLLGDLAEGLLLSLFAVLTIAMVVLQERRSEKAIEALKALGTPFALVVRGGTTQRIPGAELVPGDVLIVEEGERIAADGKLLSCHDLMVDESLLTGESVPVGKRVWTSADEKEAASEPGGNGLPFVYSGTMVTRGKGMTLVMATGVNTQIGHLGASLSSIELEPTRLQKSTGKMVRLFGVVARCGQPDPCYFLRHISRRLVAGRAIGNRIGDGDVAGRIPARTLGVLCDGCLAAGKNKSIGPTFGGDRNPGRSHSIVRG